MLTAPSHTSQRALLPVALLAVSILAGSCKAFLDPIEGAGFLEVVSRGVGSDTIGTERVDVILRVRDAAGRTITGDQVNLGSAAPAGAPDVMFVDANRFSDHELFTGVNDEGVVRFTVRFGTRTGRAWIRVSAYGQVDSLSFQITAGNPAAVAVAPADTVMYVARNLPLRASVTDRGGNPLPGALTFTADSAAATVTGTGAVTTQAVGRARIRVASGTWADTMWISVVPQATLAALRPAADPRPLQLIRVGLDGSDVTVIRTGLWTHPEWHPSGDGRLIAVDEGFYEGRAFLIAGDLSSRPLLSTFVEYQTWDHTPRWSADGQWIVFSGRNSAPGIWRAKADGSEPVQLTPGFVGSGDVAPAASPDGQRIVFLRSGIDSTLTKVMHVPSGTQRQLPFTSGAVRWLPNGNGFVALVGAQVIVTDTAGVTQRSIAVPRDMSVGSEPDISLSPDGAWALVNTDFLPTDSGRNTLLVRLSDGLLLPLPWARGLAWPAWKP